MTQVAIRSTISFAIAAISIHGNDAADVNTQLSGTKRQRRSREKSGRGLDRDCKAEQLEDLEL